MFDPFFHFSLPNSLGSLRNVPLVYGISVSGQTLPNLPGRGQPWLLPPQVKWECHALSS